MNKRMAILIFVLWGQAFASLAEDLSILGFWQTLEDGKPRSVVEIYLQNGKLHGRVDKVFLASGEAEPICTGCKGWRKDQPIQGLEILSELQPRGDMWVDGRVFSPERNQEFNCDIWRDGQKLKLKVSWGFISKTEIWHRVSSERFRQN